MYDPSARHVNVLSPVNLSHPLAQGLGAWWKAIPFRMGTATWFDLVQGLAATLVGVSPTNAWRDTARPGGMGELRLDGVGYVSGGTNPTVDVTSTAFSIGCWVKFNSLTSDRMILSRDNGTLSTQYNLNLNGSVDFRISTSTLNTVVHPGIVIPVAGVWYHVIGVYDGSRIDVFTSGVASGHPEPNTGPVAHIATEFEIGARNGGTNLLNGSFDDVMIWPYRGLTAGEVVQLVDETAAGCPELLNWQTTLVVYPLTPPVFRGSAAMRLAAVASGVVVRPAAALVVVTARAVALQRATASLVLTATARAVKTAVAVVRLTAAASGLKVVRAGVVVVLRARARAPRQAQAVPGEDLYLGRFQVGQEVPVWLQCFHEDGYQGMPDDTPVLRLYRDNVPVGRCPVAHLAGTPGRFGGLYLLGARDLPGRYVAFLTYLTRGAMRSQMRLFEVVEGGDFQAAAVSAHSVSRPDGDQILVHAGSGVLLMGRAPYLDEGF